MAAQILYIANDHVLKLLGLTDGKTGLPINNATVEATIVNHDNQPVAGITWPVELDYVVDSDGDYEGELDEEFQVSVTGIYYLRVEAETPPDIKGRWRVPLTVKERE